MPCVPSTPLSKIHLCEFVLICDHLYLIRVHLLLSVVPKFICGYLFPSVLICGKENRKDAKYAVKYYHKVTKWHKGILGKERKCLASHQRHSQK